MTVYVDALRHYPASKVSHVSVYWCHLLADSPAELHAMAQHLGLRREWFQARPLPQHCHYDLTPADRVRALAAGAQEISTRTFLRQRQACGAQELAGPPRR